MLDHAVRIDPEPGLAPGFRLEMGPDVHPGRVEPDKEWLLVPDGAVDEVVRGADELRIDYFHALTGKRSGVLAFLLAPGAEARIVAWRVGGGGDTFEHPARPEIHPEGRVFRIILVLRLFLGVEVIEIAEELVE